MSSTTTAKAIPTAVTDDVRQRRHRRTSSSSHVLDCRPRPHLLARLDRRTASAAQTLISLRFLVLSYLADLEARLADLQAPPLPDLAPQDLPTPDGHPSADETDIGTGAWVEDAIAMLESIRADVSAHLPDLHFADFSVENVVKTHLPDIHLPDVPGIDNVRAHLPDFDFDFGHAAADMRAHLPDFDFGHAASEMRLRLDDVRARLSELDFAQPLSFIPVLAEQLTSLHSHLSVAALPALPQRPALSGLLDALLASDVFGELVDETRAVVVEGEERLLHVAEAVRRSFHGAQLIRYADLPKAWQNNRFITGGYRFIPPEKWPLLFLSMFHLHNETLNIHTHLIPFLAWGLTFLPWLSSHSLRDTPELIYIFVACLTLFLSVVWHIMSGCAHYNGMELCARADYVGIGWLISASVGTVVYYGFREHPVLRGMFLGFCFMGGLTSNILPFMDWFNKIEYRAYRLAFFVILLFTVLIAPLANLAYLYTVSVMLTFIKPVLPSLLSYSLGFVFYATHFPECVIGNRWFDRIGMGSHAIWHLFIVMAISQHRASLEHLKAGIES